MSARILLFVEDPGAANAMLGLPKVLSGRGIEAHVVATGAAELFLENKLDGFAKLVPETTADALMDSVRPAAVLVGTSENPKTLGLTLVDAARRRGLPTAGFVDAFPNASFRFRGLSDDPLAHCPDFVLVPDDWTKSAFLALGLEERRIAVTGHPHYDGVLSKAEELDREGRAAVRARVLRNAPPDVQVVIFAAEISTGFDPDQFRRSHAYTLEGRGTRHGRTEIVVEELLDAVRALRPKPHFVLRLHPKNTLEEFGDLVREFDSMSQSGSALEVVYAGDLVIGMTSTILVEANLLKRRTLSVVPRPLEREWLPTIRAGLTPAATTRDELRRELAAWASNPDRPVTPFVGPGALDRTVNLLAELTGHQRSTRT